MLQTFLLAHTWNRWMDRQQTDRQTDIQIDRRRDRQTYRHTASDNVQGSLFESNKNMFHLQHLCMYLKPMRVILTHHTTADAAWVHIHYVQYIILYRTHTCAPTTDLELLQKSIDDTVCQHLDLPVTSKGLI